MRRWARIAPARSAPTSCTRSRASPHPTAARRASTDASGSSDDATTDPTNGEPGCGNGVIEGTELCDDGNAVDFDGCNADCIESGSQIWSNTYSSPNAGADDRALGVTEIIPDESLGFYNYEAKYAEGGSRHVLPAPVSPIVYQLVQNLALTAHKALGCRGVSRADFRYDDTPSGSGEVYCLEVNTQPGMTATSLVPELAAHAGLSFAELVSWMVEDASCSR